MFVFLPISLDDHDDRLKTIDLLCCLCCRKKGFNVLRLLPACMFYESHGFPGLFIGKSRINRTILLPALDLLFLCIHELL